MTEEIKPTLEEIGIAASSGTGALRVGYHTTKGQMFVATIEDLLDSDEGRALKGQVQMIFTSPPFPLNRKKKYGNLTGEAYVDWIKGLARPLRDLLTPDGSIVMEIGNAWEPGRPVMSTLAMRALLAFMDEADLRLCQQFVCHNPARLPTPAQWVNIKRIRVKDSFTHVWWMAATDEPKANNRNVLKPYKKDMLDLLRTKKYNAGLRPSGHNIGETSFLTDNGGAIPPNVLEISNTGATTQYRRYCREVHLDPHPAPMQSELVDFFVRFLTDNDDLVLDPFGGSNTTGAVAEQLGRRWQATEPNEDYVEGSMGRFDRFYDEATSRNRGFPL